MQHSTKLVVIGDKRQDKGKIALLYRFKTGKEFTNGIIPAVFDNQNTYVTVDGQITDLEFIDTSGQEEYKNLRSMNYDEMDVALICFNFDNIESLTNVEASWIPELELESERMNSAMPHVLLVGISMSDSIDISPTMRETANSVAKRIGAYNGMFYECNPMTGNGVDIIFEDAVRSTFSDHQCRMCGSSECCVQ